MRAVVQRVTQAKVTVGCKTENMAGGTSGGAVADAVDGVVNNAVAGSISKGMVVLLGIGADDDSRDIDYLAEKVVNLRIFDDHEGKMNISLTDCGGAMLLVSQFTLYGDCRRGRRPSYDAAARPETAQTLYEAFADKCRSYGIKVETGVFQAMMQVELINDGPVTILLDSRKMF